MGVPSLLPSAVPSSLPSVSSSPSSLPSVIPSSLLSVVPSSLPSAVPTSLPTSSPTTSSPTTSCVNATDNDKIKFDVNHSSKKFKGCKWLRNHPANIAEFCEVGKGAYLNCKETCCKLTCDNCDNPTGSSTNCVDLKQSGVKFDYTRFKSDGVTVKKEKTGKKCRNLAKESEANIEESCDNDMVNEGLTVANYCKATCDNCGDDSAAPSISELSSISPLPQPHMMPSSLKTSIPSTNVSEISFSLPSPMPITIFNTRSKKIPTRPPKITFPSLSNNSSVSLKSTSSSLLFSKAAFTFSTILTFSLR